MHTAGHSVGGSRNPRKGILREDTQAEIERLFDPFAYQTPGPRVGLAISSYTTSKTWKPLPPAPDKGHQVQA